MNVNATFYTFSKRENSTKKPTEDGTTIQVSFKDETDLFTPILEVVYAGAFNFNYCYIDFTARYYKITAADTIAKNTYRLHLQTDVLATFRDDVKGQRVYALYCSYDFDELLDDERVSPKPVYNVESEFTRLEVLPIEPVTEIETIYSFMSVINNNGLLNGIDVFYALGNGLPDQFLKSCADRSFIQNVFGSATGSSPLDAVNEIWWSPLIPQNCHAVSSNSAQLYDVVLSGDVIARPTVKKHHTTLDVPKPTNRDFRYSEKYVKYYLQIPFVGTITLPTNLMRDRSQIEIAYAGDCLTGQLAVAPKVNAVSMGLFGTSLKAPLPLARQQNHVAQVVTNGATGAAAGMALAAKAGGGLAGIAAAVSMTAAGAIRGIGDMPDIDKTSSSVGSIAPLGCGQVLNACRLVMIEAESNIEPSSLASVAGRPCNRITTVQNGYVMTSNASVSFAGTPDEIDAFNAYLNGGIYVE